MFVCICEAVTEDEVELAVLSGADTVEAVTEATEAGSCCGTCHPAIEAILERTCPLRTGAMAERRCSRIDLTSGRMPQRRTSDVGAFDRSSHTMSA